MDLIPSIEIILLLRLVVPIFILRFPLVAFIMSLHLDAADHQYFNVLNHPQFQSYQLLDKLLDTYMLTFALIVASGWKEATARRLAFISYFYRLLGVFLYLRQPNPLYFFIFPNFFEIFFLFYLLFRLVQKQAPLFLNSRSYLVIIPLLLFPKILHELTHLTEISGLAWATLLNQYRTPILAAAYLIFPLAALSWRLKQKGPSSTRSK